MHALAGIVFHMNSGDADAGGLPIDGNVHMTVLGKRLVILRDLVTLRQIRIEIVLARKSGKRTNFAVQRYAGTNRHLHRIATEHRKRSRHSETNRTNVAVWLCAETRGTVAEDLGARTELNVYFQPDDDLVFRQDIRRNRGAQGCGHCLDYSPLTHADSRRVRLRRLCSRRRKYQREREYLLQRRGLDVHNYRRFRKPVGRVVAE